MGTSLEAFVTAGDLAASLRDSSTGPRRLVVGPELIALVVEQAIARPGSDRF